MCRPANQVGVDLSQCQVSTFTAMAREEVDKLLAKLKADGRRTPPPFELINAMENHGGSF